MTRKHAIAIVNMIKEGTTEDYVIAELNEVIELIMHAENTEQVQDIMDDYGLSQE